MSNLDKSTYLGGIYSTHFSHNAQSGEQYSLSANTLHNLGNIGWERNREYIGTRETKSCLECDIKDSCKYFKLTSRLANFATAAKTSGKFLKNFFRLLHKKLKKLKIHIWEKQDLYIPVMLAIILLALVFVSKAAFSKTPGQASNLPIEDKYKLKLIGTIIDKQAVSEVSNKNQAEESSKEQNDLKTDVEKIVKNTPMEAMIDSISRKPRPVAAFIVGIAMKESKFGVYSPRLGGRDCYNYWGFKGGGPTVAGGYSCFSSPDQAVDAVGSRIEKLVAKGATSPARMISWKCGSSCAGHGEENVRKWIADVAVNFYKINS